MSQMARAEPHRHLVLWLHFQRNSSLVWLSKSHIYDYHEERKAERKQRHIVSDGVDSFYDGEVRKVHDKPVRVLHRSDFIIEEYAIHSGEVTECGTQLVDRPFGHPIPPNASQYGTFLTTPPNLDEAPVTSPLSRQKDLYGSRPLSTATQKARASGPRISPPTTGMRHGASGGSSFNIHHPRRLD
jgi:hypothetical protein